MEFDTLSLHMSVVSAVTKLVMVVRLVFLVRSQIDVVLVFAI